MSEDSINKPGEESHDTFEMLASTMATFREEMEGYDSLGIRIAARTTLIIKVVFTTLFISSIYLGVMIFEMANNMSAMTTHLEDMYSNFGTMSEDMHLITQSVNSMDRSISGIPVIADSMIKMDNDVGGMTSSIYEINQSITGIDNDMVKIKINMQEMTGRLSNMSHAVNLMSYDVNEMATPMNSGPMSGFWSR